MADTLTNIPVPAEEWVDVYDLSSITPGLPVNMQNIGANTLYYSISSTEPDKDSDKYRIFRRGSIINLSDGDLKVWIFSPHTDGLINIAEFSFIASSESPRDFLIEVAKGNIPGHSVRGLVMRSKNITDVDFIDIWGGAANFIPPTANETWEILSSNVDDTLLGTGARTVLVNYLDDSYARRSLVVNLDGTNAVTLNSDMFRPDGAVVISSGSDKRNEGDITIQVSGGGDLRQL